MNHSEQTRAFGESLDALVDRYAHEFDLTYAAIIGVLFTKATLLVQQLAEEADDSEL